MNTNYDKIKSDLLDFGKRHGACIGQYQRLYKAESIEDVISVVKDNFEWCIQYKDFTDVLMANREQFAEHRIWINQNVEIQEGVGFLLATEGTINVNSYGTSTINVNSCDTSTINVKSYGTSTMIIHTLNIECEVNDRSIARYIYDNRIVIADTSVTVEQYHK